MNEVDVFGGKAKEREIAEAAVLWCINKMMPRMRTLDIRVAILKEKDMKSAMGYCLEGENNRDFDLMIKKGMTIFDLISTVCHEMVHVKQYARGELKWRHRVGKQQWKSTVIAGELDYMDLPWEKEAFKKERALALQCFEEIAVCL